MTERFPFQIKSVDVVPVVVANRGIDRVWMAILLAFPLPANPLRSVLFIPESGLLELFPGNLLSSHFHANFDLS